VFVQDAIGRAETLLASVRAYQFDVMGDLWTTLVDGGQPSATQTARFITAAPHLVGGCADVVQLVFKAAGGSAVYREGPFERCLRDILTMNQHVVATSRTYEMAGRMLGHGIIAVVVLTCGCGEHFKGRVRHRELLRKDPCDTR
jgi:indole-3-acetate monooxygenase